MKTKYMLWLTVSAALFVACTEQEKGSRQESLKVEPSMLTFEAVEAPSRELAVTAVGMEWEVEVASQASEWLSATKTGTDKVVVSVADNKQADPRTGTVTVFVPGDDGLRNRRAVTVTQEGNDNPEVYSLSLSVKELAFEAENTAEQQVVVTVQGEGLTWEAVPDADWITVKKSGDGFSVAVQDNTRTTERTGVITVTPSDASVGTCRLAVRQAAGELPPSLEVNYTEFLFKPNGEFLQGEAVLYVTVQNCGWSWRTVDEAGDRINWILIEDGRPKYDILTITCSVNEGEAERVGYLEIIPDAEELETVRVTITQGAVKDHLSELTDDVDLTEVSRNAYVHLVPLNDWEERATPWTFRFWSDGIEYDDTQYPPYFATGGYIEFEVYSEKILYNDDSEYDLPTGVYTVTRQENNGMDEGMNTITAGYQIATMWNPEVCIGAWYYYMENDVVVAKAPITEGTLTVERDGDRYILIFDFRDDLGFSLAGRREGALSIVGDGVPSPRA